MRFKQVQRFIKAKKHFRVMGTLNDHISFNLGRGQSRDHVIV